MTELLLTTSEYAALRRCSPRTVERERVDGSGCKFVRIGGRVLYRREDIDTFIAARVVGSTSEYSTLGGVA